MATSWNYEEGFISCLASARSDPSPIRYFLKGGGDMTDLFAVDLNESVETVNKNGGGLQSLCQD